MYCEFWAELYQARYILDPQMRIRAAHGTPTVSIAQLKQMFLSKDPKDLEKMKWVFDNEPKFFDGKPYKGEKVAFGSFPRSGNTFLRKYFELITGI